MRWVIKVAGVFVCFLVCFNKSYGQSFGVRQFTIQHGLPTSQIKALLKDDLGYLWIGTHGGGLVRFDGNEFVTYTTSDGLINNYVTSLCKDRHGDLWIGTLMGISRFDGLSFTSVGLNLKVEASHKESMIDQMVEHRDSILVLNDADRIGVIKGNRVQWIKTKEPAKFIVTGIGSQILYQSVNDKLIGLSDSNFSLKLEKGIDVFGVVDFFGTPVLNTGIGLLKFDSLIVRSIFENQNSGPILLSNRDSLVWSMQDRLRQFKINGNELIPGKLFPQISQITSWVEDESGGVWIGTYTQGLFNLRKREFEKFYSTTNQEAIMPIERTTDGAFWFGTYGSGLIKFGRNGQRIFSFKDDKRKNYTADLQVQQSSLWVGTMGGLGVLKSGQLKWMKDSGGQPIDSVISIDLDHKNRIWVGRASKGIEMIEDFRITHIPFQNKAAIAIKYYEADSTLYIGTFQGLFKYAKGAIQKIHINSLKTGIIRSLDIYRNKYLVFTSEEDGVCFYDLVDGAVTRVTSADGLLSPILYFIKVEDDFIWVGSVLGLNRIRMSENLDIQEIAAFNDKNGFEGIETNSNSAYVDGGVKLFGSIDGVYRFIDGKIPDVPAGKLHFQDVKLFYGEQSARIFSDSLSGFFRIPVHPVFDKSANHITFKFKSVSSSMASKVRYTFLLENFDNRWSRQSESNEVTYSALPPGDYNFRVRSIDGTSDKVVDEINYSFSINPAFYETGWFLTIALALGILLIVLIFRMQLRRKVSKMLELANVRVEENQRLRQEIARDFHDEMGNHLVIVSSNVNLLLMQAEGKDKIEMLGKMAQSIKYINLRTRDFIWSINPSNNNLDDLFLYLRDFGDGLFKNSNIVFRAENKVINDYPVSYRFSRETILIFKEAFTNILKHSRAVNVFFCLKSSNFMFAMEVIDDGVGIVEKEKSKGGLSNIAYRAKKIGAALLLDTHQNEGTKIGLNFSLDGNKRSII